MSKRKLNTEITVTTNKKSLKDITGIDKDLGLKTTADKACQTEPIEIVEEDFFEDETNHYLLLELIANALESSDVISESIDGDQIDGFRETIKLLVGKLIEQIKDSIKNDATKPDNKKQKFIKALIRIFSILLNANLTSAKKITKIIKQSAKLVINLWPGQKSLLDGSGEATKQESLFQDHKEDQTSQTVSETDTIANLTDAIAKSTQLKIVDRMKKTRFKIKKLLPQRKTVQIKKNGQVVKTMSVHRKSYYFNGNKAKQYQFY